MPKKKKRTFSTCPPPTPIQISLHSASTQGKRAKNLGEFLSAKPGNEAHDPLTFPWPELNLGTTFTIREPESSNVGVCPGIEYRY